MSAQKIKVVKKPLKKAAPLAPQTMNERLQAWIDKNRNYLIGAVVVIVLPLLVTWGVKSYHSRKEMKAREAYLQLDEKAPSQESADQPGEKSIPDLEKFVRDYSGTAAALDAQIVLQKAYYRAKRYEDAVRLGDELSAKLPKDHALRPLVLYQTAYAAQALGKADEALAKWTELKQGGYPGLQREADSNLARLYAAKKEYSKASESYKEAIQDPGSYPQTALLEQELASLNIQMGAATPNKPSTDGGS